jgi:hypothetical protein
MSDKKTIIFVLVAFAAGWFAKGYFSTAMADEISDDGESKEEEAED